VIALAAGGALETVAPEETGVLFLNTTEESLAEATERAHRIKWSPDRIRENADRFSKKFFVRETEKFIRRVTGTEFRQMNDRDVA